MIKINLNNLFLHPNKKSYEKANYNMYLDVNNMYKTEIYFYIFDDDKKVLIFS